MTERPILFSGPMVSAILDGRKTQTRRVIAKKNSEIAMRWEWLDFPGGVVMVDGEGSGCEYLHCRANQPYSCAGTKTVPVQTRIFPRVEPGDRLWVRETWAPVLICENRVVVAYRADGAEAVEATARESLLHEPGQVAQAWRFQSKGTWCPSIHMPRWASRITLEVTGVRAQRVQEITEDDAIAEGIKDIGRGCGKIETPRGSSYSTILGLFGGLWDSINAKRGYGWEANPWVWAIEFKTITEG